MRTVGFYRDFAGYSGGHGKVFDYFGHVRAHPGFAARIVFAAGSLRDASNPWRDPTLEDAVWNPARYDALFLAGLDWQLVPDDDPARPVLNLIQGVRHGDPDDVRHAFLSRPAIRLCVSQAVADAIVAGGRVNGPVYVIPNAVDVPLAPPRVSRGGQLRVFIAGQKNVPVAAALAAALAADPTLDVDVAVAWLARSEFLDRLARADIAVLLPQAREGFFLPGLEAMAAGAAAIVPDCVGNRDYARDLDNCLMPPATVAALTAAVRRLRDDAALRHALAQAGQATARRHAPAAERAAFHAILDRLDDEWSQCRHAI